MTTAKKTPAAAKAEPKDLVKLTVACPAGRRFRAGLEFGKEPADVEVTAEQAEQIQADPLLAVSAPKA